MHAAGQLTCRGRAHTAAPPRHRPWTTFLPLGLVLGIAMIKEAIEDYKRYRQDVEVNNRRVEVSGRQLRWAAAPARDWAALELAGQHSRAGGFLRACGAAHAHSAPSMPTQVFDAGVGDFVAKTWADVRVGDVIMVYKVGGSA